MNRELEALFVKTLEDFKKLDPTSNEAKARMAQLNQMAEQLAKLKTAEAEAQSNKMTGIAALITAGVGAVVGIGGLVLRHIWCGRNLRFEETGSFTSKAIQVTNNLLK